jgi:hypothetical protein
MTGATSGSGWTGSGDSGFDLAISGDGQAFTLTFAEFEADLDGGKSPDLFAARVFSAVLPIEGDGSDVDIAFTAQGFARSGLPRRGRHAPPQQHRRTDSTVKVRGDYDATGVPRRRTRDNPARHV